jgi:CheY-like chemotaxis protein
MELHQGSVEVRSEGLGRGSEFLLRLRPLDPIIGANSALGDLASRATLNYASRRVLIVEDNKDVADALELLLDSLGHETTVARDGWTALQMAEDFGPEVALVDIGIPGINGYELARMLRSDPRFASVQLIAMTGYGRDEDRDAARAAGFDAHLVKPAEMERLRSLLETRE